MLATFVLTTLVALAPSDGTGGGANAAAPGPAASKAALHEIAHVKALTPYCAAFSLHFNGAARPIVDADQNVALLGYTLGNVESHFHARAGELKIYDDRVRMMAYVGKLQALIPQAQAEIDKLRASGALASDPDTVAANHALAADLQAALDKQRQIAIDSQSVTQALTDYSLNPTRPSFEDLGNLGNLRTTLALLSRPDPMGYLGGLAAPEAPRASTELQSSIPGGYDEYDVRTPAERRDVRSYLHWQNQVDRIGDAEGRAATGAQTLADGCR